MLMDIKTWLEVAGMKAAEERFLKPPALPYLIFTEELNSGGADDKNCIADRRISIELYSDKINRDAETKIENLLNERAIEFKRDRQWIDSEKFFQTVYDFNLVEKF